MRSWWPLVCTLGPVVNGSAQFVPVIALAVCIGGIARADSVEIDLSSLVNSDLTAYTGGGSYPQHGGAITVDTIPFELATIGSRRDTAVIQTNGAQDFSIPVGLFGATSADVLVNSAFGSCGADVGEIDFVGASETYSYQLTEGVNLRDHFNGGFCNSIGNTKNTASFGADRLDLESIQLPPAFSGQTLESIDFKGFGNAQLGEPFLAAATILTPVNSDPAPVPEPPELVVVCVATAILLLRGRMRQQWG